MTGRKLDRRALLAAAGASAFTPALAAPLRKLRAEAPRVTIKDIVTFDVVVPQSGPVPPPRARVEPGRINVTCVETDAGITGYSFMGSTAPQVAAARTALTGEDLFRIENLLARGLINWGAVEEAVWDAIGRIAGQPVSRLLGGASLPEQPVYATYVWPGSNGQESISPRQQADQAGLLRAAGFTAMKIQIFRRDFQRDAEACAEILAVGGSGFRVMVDRTADRSPHGLWRYDEALAAAQALKEVGCFWLEEPLARDDYEGPARLARESGMTITGGEGYHGLEPFRQCLQHGTYAVLQPELRQVAGIWTARKVGALAEAWGLKTAPHGISGLALAGRMQLAAAMGSVYQEIAVLNPPWLPEDYCRPFLPLLHGEQPFRFRGGACVVPQGPGLGLAVDAKALARYRVGDLRALGGPPFPPP